MAILLLMLERTHTRQTINWADQEVMLDVASLAPATMKSTRREIIVATSAGTAVWLGDADVDVELAEVAAAVLGINEEDEILEAEEAGALAAVTEIGL